MNCCDYDCNQGRDCPARKGEPCDLAGLPIGYIGEEPESDCHGYTRVELWVAIVFWAVVTAVATSFVWRLT